MGSQLEWEPLQTEFHHIASTDPDAMAAALARANLELPCVLGEEEVPILVGLLAASQDLGYNRLIAAIAKHGKIRIRPVW